MNDNGKISWLRLIRTENIGPVTFRTLLEHFGSAEKALERLPDFARKGGRVKPLRLCSVSEAEKEMEALYKAGGEFVALPEEDYPSQLSVTPDAPPLFAILGNRAFLKKPYVALVGTRNASINGKNMARRMAADFVKAGWSVVSGLALGIDAAAHEGALYAASGDASTAAVLGTGVDVAYPERNRKLYDALREKGLLVSDYPLHTKPQPSNFPRRNRIISGMASGLVVIEAALRSGSLITANKALEQGRDVFAVPANPLDPRAQGVNHLIKTGAPLVESAQDVLEQLGAFRALPLSETPPPLLPSEPETCDISDISGSDARERILRELDAAPADIDALVRETGLPARAISVLLVELELAEQIERLPGNRVVRISPC